MAYKNKEDQKACSAKHYLANKKSYKSRARDRNNKTRKDNKKYVNNYLKEHPCVDCGESDPIVLEFDHIKGIKTASISDMLTQNRSLLKIKLEITKCEVRCANCHRRVTHQRRLNSEIMKNSKQINDQLKLELF